jgi:hypothetical protein
MSMVQYMQYWHRKIAAMVRRRPKPGYCGGYAKYGVGEGQEEISSPHGSLFPSRLSWAPEMQMQTKR